MFEVMYHWIQGQRHSKAQLERALSNGTLKIVVKVDFFVLSHNYKSPCSH